MRYPGGEEARLGDKVKLWEGCVGVVVFSVDAGQYTAEFPEEHWSYLRTGVMFRTDSMGLIYYDEADEDMELLERAPGD